MVVKTTITTRIVWCHGLDSCYDVSTSTHNSTSKGASQVVLMGKKLPANAGGTDLIPGSGRSAGGGHSNSLQYSCLENPMDREAWQATIHEVAKSQTQLNNHHHQ